jgi:HK97 family phage major capsid protein
MGQVENTLNEIKTGIEEFKSDYAGQLEELKNKGMSSEKVEELLAKQNEKMDERFKDIEETLRKEDKSLPGLEDELENRKKKDGYGFHFSKAFFADHLMKQHGARVGEAFDKVDGGFEKEVIDNMVGKNFGDVNKAVSANDGSSGGFLIAEEVADEIIAPALAQMPVYDMGLTVLRDLQGDILLPKMTSRPSADHVAENAAPTASDPAFGQVKLTPKEVAALTKVSEKFLRQSVRASEPFIRQELQNSARLEMHNGILNGTGSDNEPLGIVNFENLTTTAVSSLADERFTLDKMDEMKTNLLVTDLVEDNDQFGFLMRPEHLRGVRAERIAQYSGQTNGDYALGMILFNKRRLEEASDSVIRTTTQFAKGGSDPFTANVICGIFRNLVLGIWGGMELRSSAVTGDSTGSAFTQRQVWLLAVSMYDTAARHEESFTVQAFGTANDGV